MIVVVIMLMIVVVIMLMIFVLVVMIMDMHFSVKVFSFSPNQSRANGSLYRERAAITETPLKNATKHAVNGVMLGFTIKVGIKTTVAFDDDNGSEIELACFKSFSTAAMGAVGESRRTCCKRECQQAEKQEL